MRADRVTDTEQAELAVRFLAETISIVQGRLPLRIKRKLAKRREAERETT